MYLENLKHFTFTAPLPSVVLFHLHQFGCHGTVVIEQPILVHPHDLNRNLVTLVSQVLCDVPS